MHNAKTNVRHLFVYAAAATALLFALPGCSRSDGGDGEAAKDKAPPKSADSNFVVYDATLVTNVSLSAGPVVTMGYASLDGKGEWRRMFDASEVSTAEDALAYVDGVCRRCDATVRNRILPLYVAETRLAGLEEDGQFGIWEVDKELYLVIETEKGDVSSIVMFDFVLYDGKVLRRLVPFQTLPQSKGIWDCIRQARTNPAALNNIAAMLCNDVAMRSAVSRQYINFLLLLAGGAGDPIACRNLALYYASSLADDYDKDYKRDFWLRRTSEAVIEKQQKGFAPELEHREVADWPR